MKSVVSKGKECDRKYYRNTTCGVGLHKMESVLICLYQLEDTIQQRIQLGHMGIQHCDRYTSILQCNTLSILQCNTFIATYLQCDLVII